MASSLLNPGDWLVPNLNFFLAVYREIDVDLYQGIIEESQKKNSRWQITLDTKTAMKILDIDEDVIEGFIKEGNAYEVSYTT